MGYEMAGVNATRVTATGQVLTGGTTNVMQGLCSIVLTADASNDADVVVRDGDSGGTVLFTLRALAGDSEVFPQNFPIAVTQGNVHLTITGTGSPEVTVLWK